MAVIDHPSPNFNARRTRVQYVVLHYTGMASAGDALKRLCDPAAQVSAHYLIDVQGQVFRLVSEDQRAWHAGVSFWRGERDINSASIGIELANPGHDWGYSPFPTEQIRALRDLLGDIRERHSIAQTGLLAHSDIAPSRKQDPGELFPWHELSTAGFGVWPEETQIVAGHPDLTGAFRRLADIGYAVPTVPEEGSDILNPDSAATDVIKAFQRRYMPYHLDGHLDTLTCAKIAAVAVATAAARPARGGAASRLSLDPSGQTDHFVAAPDGRTAAPLKRRGKSGLHGSKVPGNARRGRP